MAFFGLFGGKRHERAGFELYTSAVRAARDPYFYAELGVPDTLDGQFDMIGLFVVLVIDRLQREGEAGAALAQAVFDAMFSDMDFTLREMGVSDMSVGRQVKAMWEALNGRSSAYVAPLAAGDRPALVQALARNVWRGGAAGVAAETLADVAFRLYRSLAEQPFSEMLHGRVTFVPAVVPA